MFSFVHNFESATYRKSGLPTSARSVFHVAMSDEFGDRDANALSPAGTAP
jgi:hypothetical protein